VTIDSAVVENALNDLGLKKKPQSMTDAKEAFPEKEQKGLLDEALASGLVFIVSGDLDQKGISYGNVHVAEFSQPDGSEQMAKVWATPIRAC